jgi:hypothetical protein
MAKIILIILLILSIYIYATISSSSRSDMNHTIALIPHHVGTVFNAISDRAMGLQDYHTEQ